MHIMIPVGPQWGQNMCGTFTFKVCYGPENDGLAFLTGCTK